MKIGKGTYSNSDRVPDGQLPKIGVLPIIVKHGFRHATDEQMLEECKRRGLIKEPIK